MGTKVTVDEIVNVDNSSGVATVNENLEKLADEFDKVQYRDGSLAATGDWDLDSNRILNLPDAITAGEPIPLRQGNLYIDAVASLQNFYSSKAEGEANTEIGEFFSYPDGLGSLIYAERTLLGSDIFAEAATKAQIDTKMAIADLASSDANKGAALVALKNGNVKQAINYVTPEMFGAVGDGVTDDTAAIQAAIDAGPGVGSKIVRLSGKAYMTSAPLIIPNNVSFVGVGRGHGGANRHTTILYTGTSGACLEQRGFYNRIAGLYLDYEGANKAGVTGVLYAQVSGTSGGSVTRTDMEDVTVLGFGTGIQNAKIPTSFSHYHDLVYIKDCTVGLDFAFVNNFVFSRGFLESNGTHGIFTTFTNVIFDQGTVIETFGDERLSETLNTVAFVLNGGREFTINDCYSEIGTQLTVPGTLMKLAELTDIQGFRVNGGFFNRSAQNQAPLVLIKDDRCRSVRFTDVIFQRGPSTGIDYIVAGDTGFENEAYKAQVWGNTIKYLSSAKLLEKPVDFTPVLTQAGAAIDGIGYAVQEAICMLAGDTCTVQGKIVLNAIGAPAAGVLQLALPIAARNFLGADMEQIGQFHSANISVVTSAGMCSLESGSNQLTFYRPDIITTVKGNNLASNSTIRFTITYLVDPQIDPV